MELFDHYDLDIDTNNTFRGNALETSLVFGNIVDAVQEHQSMTWDDDDDMTTRYASHNRSKENLEYLL